jgi:DNA-binding MarR family transcriptional regulator
MATTRDHLEQRALLATRSLVDRMRALYRELERLTGAPIGVHRALACIGDEPGITASKLALSLGMRRPAVSHVLRGLVERGWVERVRSDSDQRSVRVYLTAAGRTVLGATAGRAVGALQRSVRRLSHDKLEALAAGVEEVLRHLPAPTGVPVRFRVSMPRAKNRATPVRRSVAYGRSSGKVQR